MCGIAGIYSFNGKTESSWITAMTDILRHRGPDDEGFLAVEAGNGNVHHLTGTASKVQGPHIETFNRPANLLLGHRRLSILDTSPLGHQPMSNRNRTLWVIYNGELYNYKELREELKNLGHEFRTGTDTEVLLASYEQWGEDCLQRFNGMWSFVIFDRRKNRLFGARDRFGVKPFYYYLDNNFFVFASEIKAILKLPFIKTGMSSGAVFEYLVHGHQEFDNKGFFRNISELRPSSAFRFELSTNTFNKREYFSLPCTDRWEQFDKTAMANHTTKIRELLYHAITVRLRSDVAIGSCLSGGIDSSAIVCIINKLIKKNPVEQIGDRQKVITACYENDPIDESRWAKIVVEETKTSWFKTCPAAGELIEDLEDLVYTHDIPFGSTSIYAQYRVMKLARDSGIKVLLDGQGGDELFTGYSPLYGAFFAEMLKHGRLARLIEEWRTLGNSPVNRKYLLSSLMNIAGARLLPAFIQEKVVKARGKENVYIDQDFWNAHYHSSLVSLKDKAKTSLNQKLYEYMAGTNLKTLLRYEDRNSMRFSIESRTPFADDIHLINYMFQVPSTYKIYQGWSKYLLREVTKGIIPEGIRQRKDKAGFITPEYHWLNEIKDSLRGFISQEAAGVLNINRIKKDWDSLIASQPVSGFSPLWRIINFSIWKKTYNV